MLQALQLLEYLIKHGGERVIDHVRLNRNIQLLKMLRQFQYIDRNGKDQGLNVRNRVKELLALAADTDRIRTERKKAQANRQKFGGVEGGRGLGGGMSGSGSGRYAGFGSEDASFGRYDGRAYGDGGGFGGNDDSGFHDSADQKSYGRKDQFEEYDEGDDGAITSPSRQRHRESLSNAAVRKKQEDAKPKEPEVDLFSFGDDEIPPKTPPKPSAFKGKQAGSAFANNSNGGADDDEFDDFISAPQVTSNATTSNPSISVLQPTLSGFSISSSNTQIAAPKPVSGSQGANISGLVGFQTISPAPRSYTSTPQPTNTFSSPTPIVNQSVQQLHNQLHQTGYQAPQPNYFTSVPAAATTSSFAANSTQGTRPSPVSNNSFTKPAAKVSSSGDAFGNLWSSASAGAGIKKTGTSGSQGPKLADLAKAKASQGIWGATGATSSASVLGGNQNSALTQPQPQQYSQSSGGGGLNDLLG